MRNILWWQKTRARSLSTAVPGLFVAGDVTDVSEKQGSIAVGQGAMAAISAHKYLAKNGLTKSRVETKDPWQWGLARYGKAWLMSSQYADRRGPDLYGSMPIASA